MDPKNTYSRLIDKEKKWLKSQFLKEDNNNKDKYKHKRVIMLELRERERERERERLISYPHASWR